MNAEQKFANITRRRLDLKWTWGVTTLIVLSLLALLLVPWRQTPQHETRPPELSVMRVIIGALEVYVAEHHGDWPTSLSPWLSEYFPDKPSYYGLRANGENVAESFVYFHPDRSISAGRYRLILMTSYSMTSTNRGWGRWSWWLGDEYQWRVEWLTESKAQAYLQVAASGTQSPAAAPGPLR